MLVVTERDDIIGLTSARHGRLVDRVRDAGSEVAIDAASRDMTTDSFQELAEPGHVRLQPHEKKGGADENYEWLRESVRENIELRRLGKHQSNLKYGTYRNDGPALRTACQKNHVQ